MKMLKYNLAYLTVMEDEAVLENVGLSKTEARVYLALNGLGEATVHAISKRSKTFRANVYDALDRLVDKGLVSYITKDNAKHYTTTDPVHLATIVKDKEMQLMEIIPKLKVMKLSSDDESVAITRGIIAIGNSLHEILEFREPIYAYGIPREASEVLMTKLPNFHRERLKRKIVMKHIYNFDAKERIRYLNKLPLTEARYIDNKLQSRVVTIVCGNRVLLIHHIKNAIVITIDNRDLADTYRGYFKVLYAHAKTYR